MSRVRIFPTTRRSFLSVGFGASLFAAILPKTAVAFVDESEAAGPFVFSCFRGNGEDGLHLAWSNDGLVWQSLNGDNPLTSPVVGVLIANNGVTMIYKDERPGHKRLHAVRAARFGEAWSAVTGPILDRDWVEGPSVLKVGDRWRLYFDCYSKGHYGAAESVDGIHWVDITAQLKMPEGARHGTAFPVTRDVLDRLLQLKPDK
jgi:hypothetical protein